MKKISLLVLACIFLICGGCTAVSDNQEMSDIVDENNSGIDGSDEEIKENGITDDETIKEKNDKEALSGKSLSANDIDTEPEIKDEDDESVKLNSDMTGVSDNNISANISNEKNAVSGNNLIINNEVIRTDYTKTWKNSHEPVRGIYVTGPMAGGSGIDSLIQLLDETELNTMVIDYKNDEGIVTTDLYIKDIKALMAKLKEHNIYTIARIVCFKDPTLASENPELALCKSDGTPITDGNGVAWVNPCKEEVWEYLTMQAEDAAELGFDEIQYDYVRFPVGKDADDADYGMELTEGVKQEKIQGFLTYATNRLHEKDAIVTADVFGTIIGSSEDTARVGQSYVSISSTIDAICPMVYPSHYGNGVFGLDVPDAHPYETILNAMQKSLEELNIIPEEDRAIVRPWLQAFTGTWVNGHISYDGDEIRQQIQAVYDAGYDEWILWNAGNHYNKDGLLSE